MKKIKFFCVTNKIVNFITKKNHNLCWVGSDEPPPNYLRCDQENNIFYKEKYYSELTFHYWYWKNLLKKENRGDWIGFCQKRRYWVNNQNVNLINTNNINEYLFDEAPNDWINYEVILCKPISVKGVNKMKILKRGLKSFIKDPSILFDEKKQNLFLHFDMHHGHGNLKIAIDQLDEKNRKDFNEFMKKNTSFNPHIMFITTPEIAEKWFEDLFSWLERCEKIFNLNDFKGYDTQRIFAYLSERYLSYWFKKNFKYKEVQWVQLENF